MHGDAGCAAVVADVSTTNVSVEFGATPVLVVTSMIRPMALTRTQTMGGTTARITTVTGAPAPAIACDGPDLVCASTGAVTVSHGAAPVVDHGVVAQLTSAVVVINTPIPHRVLRPRGVTAMTASPSVTRLP